jgi:hypothetical protein
VVLALYDLAGPRDLLPPVTDAMASAARAAGADGVTELGRLVTADVPNDFPRLPVHEGVCVAAWLLSDRTGGGAGTAIAESVGADHGLPVRVTPLRPTARSTLR